MANTPSARLYQSKSRYVIGLMGVFALLSLGILCLWTLAGTGLTTALFTSLFHDSYLAHVIYITVKQSLISVFFATIIGMAGAIAFHRRASFPLRSWLLLGCFSAMIMPTTVAAVGLLKLWGKSGLIAQTPFAIFLPDRLGLWSVVLAHVFFNAPLVMRVCLSALEAVPLPQKRQAALLCLSPRDYFMILDWPVIRSVLPSIMGLVFLLCFTSFSLVLMLGGGPAVTTLEVSIYTSLRFDFNLPQAAFLSFLQLIICAFLLRIFGKGQSAATALQRPAGHEGKRADGRPLVMKLIDVFIISAIIILNIIPIALLLVQSDFIAGLPLLAGSRFWNAFLNSVTLASGAAAFALCFACILGFLAHECRLRGRHFLLQLIEISHSLFLIIPALVLGTALFILLRNTINLSAHALWLLMLGNGLLALPFCYRIIAPALGRHLTETDALSAMLNLSGGKRLVTIILPSLRGEIGFALGLSAALSFGDLGIITLFGSQAFETLPYLLFQFLNRYGANEADLLAVILLATSIGLYSFFIKMVSMWGRYIAR